MAYNFANIRQLLTDAFNDEEIRTLALDIFPDVFGDFTTGMDKGQMIRKIVDKAHRHGHISELLDYIKDKNAYQYTLYARQLGIPPVSNIYSNLPRQPFFFGREKELASVAEAISPEARTWGALIDGPGGIGKTALAIRAGHLAPGANFDRKIFLSAKVRELTPKGEQKLEDFMLPNYMTLLAELAHELGKPNLAKIAPNERASKMRRALTNARVLLIIDNLETFAEEERTRLYQFLSRLPLTCKAIVTSRRRDDIDARAIRLDRLGRDEALALMGKLAENNARLYRTHALEREKLYEITNGNPLLIRWLVGQLGRQGSQNRTIEDARTFLEKAPNGNDPLEYIFGDLLDTFTESEISVLATLVHFDQPAKVAWIAEVAGITEIAARTALEDLADRALLVGDETLENFLLPPLAATFLRRKRPDVVTEAGNRLTDRAYALALANGFREFNRYHKLEAEWPTIAAFLSLLYMDNSNNSRFQTVCDALRDFLVFSGRWDEFLTLSQQAEARAVADGDFYEAGRRAYQVGRYFARRGQKKLTEEYGHRCANHLSKAEQLAGSREKAYATLLLGLGYELAGDYTSAIEAHRKAVSLWRAIEPDSEDMAIGLNALAEAEQAQGILDSAEHHYHDALKVSRKHNDEEGIATISGNLASLALEREDWPKAENLAREALKLAEKIGKQELIGSQSFRLAQSLARQGNLLEGLQHAQRAVSIFSHLRQPKELEMAKIVLKECNS